MEGEGVKTNMHASVVCFVKGRLPDVYDGVTEREPRQTIIIDLSDGRIESGIREEDLEFLLAGSIEREGERERAVRQEETD